MKRAWEIAVLARAAVPGQAKTRLIPRLGPERAAALQAHLTERALLRAGEAGAHVALWLAGPVEARTVELAARCGAALLTQPAGDLGCRMLAAARHAHAAGRDAIIIGTDCPAQRTDDLLEARRALDACDVALQPALDGGYVMIGMRRPHPEVFKDIAWGSDAVLDATRRRCTEIGLKVAELRPLPDLDRPEDLDMALAEGVLQRADWSS